ncbi:uncharacterized protein [Equus asinus]|uniref:uncharacterized protein n=1 Tax=Equus asinus TaxID=9793 RepID=UPI0038F74BFF
MTGTPRPASGLGVSIPPAPENQDRRAAEPRRPRRLQGATPTPPPRRPESSAEAFSPKGKRMPLSAKQHASLCPHASASRLRGRGGPARRDPGDGLVLPQGFSSHGFASTPCRLQRTEGAALRSRRPVTTEMHRPRRRPRSCCWILPTARRPLPPLPPQEPRKQSAAAAAVLSGRGSGRRSGAASLRRIPSSTGSLRRGAGAYWPRRRTFVGGLLLRRSTSFDPVYLVVGGPGYRVLCFPRCFIYNSHHATMLKNINPRPSG